MSRSLTVTSSIVHLETRLALRISNWGLWLETSEAQKEVSVKPNAGRQLCKLTAQEVVAFFVRKHSESQSWFSDIILTNFAWTTKWLCHFIDVLPFLIAKEGNWEEQHTDWGTRIPWFIDSIISREVTRVDKNILLDGSGPKPARVTSTCRACMYYKTKSIAHLYGRAMH